MSVLLLMRLMAAIRSPLSLGLQTHGARWFGLPGVIDGLIACFPLIAVRALPLRYCRRARRDALT